MARFSTDIDIKTCRNEGYTVMDVNLHHFKRDPLNTECEFSWSLPDYVREDMGWKITDKLIAKRATESYNDLFEMYTKDKKSIDSFVGHTRVKLTNPTVYDVLNLASDINSYCGLGEEV